jgi:hypothetical protein
MARRVRGRWTLSVLAVLVVLVVAACRSDSDGVSWTTTTTTTIAPTVTLPNPPTTYRTVLPMTTTRTAPNTTTTAPGVVDRLGLPSTIANGEVLRLRARCPYGSDYLYLSVEFKTPEGEPTIPGGVGVRARTSAYAGQKGDGTVDTFAGVNLPPGSYVVQAQCLPSEDRSGTAPPPRTFTPFNVTVTGARRPVRLPPRMDKQWTLVVRGDEAHPREVSGAECWKYGGLVLLVSEGEGGFSTEWQMPESAVVSLEPVIRGSDGCAAR